MSLTNPFTPPKLFKYLWFGFGLAGIAVIANQYAPGLLTNLQNSRLVKGVQTELANSITSNSDPSSSTNDQLDLTQLNPQETTTAVTQVITREIKQIIQEQTEVIKEFPAKQVRKIKIGACEELLEEDICAVASEIQCSQSND